VDDQGLFVFSAGSSDSVVAIQVEDEAGTATSSSTRQSGPLPETLPPEIVDLFPVEVRDLFEDGLPATIEEATAMLTESGLLDEVTAVLNENPAAYDAIFNQLPGPETAIVGTSGPGTYRVIVSSSDPHAEVTVSLTSLDVRQLASGPAIDIAVPVLLEIDVGIGRAALLTATADSVVALDVLSPYGSYAEPSTSPAPGEPATAVLGSGTEGTYQVIVRSSDGQGTVKAQLLP
jgi:hypothetical protein